MCDSQTNPVNNDPNKTDWWVFAILIAILFMIIGIQRTCAQATAHYDTIQAKPECIDKIIDEPTSNGKSVKYYAVYNDYVNDISDIIWIPKATMDYITMCEKSNITPSLAFRMKDGSIYSLIRIKKVYKYATTKKRGHNQAYCTIWCARWPIYADYICGKA